MSSFFSRKPSDPPAPQPNAGPPVDLKNDDLPLPDEIKLGDNVLRFNRAGGGTWQLMTEASADHKRQIDDLQKRVDALLAERNNQQQQLAQLQQTQQRLASQSLSQTQASAASAAASDAKYADAGRRMQELERENQLLKWKNQVLLAMVAVRELDNDQFAAQLEQTAAAH